jgi:hypothetical protein
MDVRHALPDDSPRQVIRAHGLAGIRASKESK